MAEPTRPTPSRLRRNDRPAGGPAPARIPRWLDTGAAVSWRFLLVVAAIYVLTIVLGRLLIVVIPVVIAAMLATVLGPPAHWLRRHGWPPLLATWAVFLVAIALVGALLYWMIPTVSDQVSRLGSSAGHGIDDVKNWLVKGPLNLSRTQVNRDFDQLGKDARTHASGYALEGATIALEGAGALLLTLVTTFFFVKDGDRLFRGAIRIWGRRRADELPELGGLVWQTLSGYVRGTTINGLVNGALMGVGLYLLGVPLSLPLAVITFFGAYFPIVGAVTSGALAALVALAANGPVTALVVVGLTVLIHNVEGYLVGPLVLGRAVHLHPLVVLLAIAAGGVTAGIIGAFLAVPLTAVATTIVRFYRRMEPEVVSAQPEDD
jgi:predicted PurR-regulated permease PerM